MTFPEAPRILYTPNPLEKVVCQLRFPPILRIDSRAPADFQDTIRGRYPNFNEKAEWNIDLPANVEAEIPSELIRQVVQSSANKNYEFSTEDNNWTVNLTRTFLALTTENYTRWEEFRERLADLVEVLVEVYAPDHYSRLGLRYIDVFRRSALGLDGVSWKELLNPQLLGLLAVDELSDQITAFENKYEIDLDDEQSKVRLISRFVRAKDDGEVSFLLDSDFHLNSRVSLDQAFDFLDYYHVVSSRLIQWAVMERLSEAMNPEVIEQ